MDWREKNPDLLRDFTDRLPFANCFQCRYRVKRHAAIAPSLRHWIFFTSGNFQRLAIATFKAKGYLIPLSSYWGPLHRAIAIHSSFNGESTQEQWTHGVCHFFGSKYPKKWLLGVNMFANTLFHDQANSWIYSRICDSSPTSKLYYR